MTVKTEKNLSQSLAQAVAIDLRVVLNDARDMLDSFETYVESWDQQVDAQKEDPVTHDPRAMTETYVIVRALEQLDEILHMPTGGTRHMHYRTARQRLIQLGQAASQD
jgi:hypothetical protein